MDYFYNSHNLSPACTQLKTLSEKYSLSQSLPLFGTIYHHSIISRHTQHIHYDFHKIITFTPYNSTQKQLHPYLIRTTKTSTHRYNPSKIPNQKRDAAFPNNPFHAQYSPFLHPQTQAASHGHSPILSRSFP